MLNPELSTGGRLLRDPRLRRFQAPSPALPLASVLPLSSIDWPGRLAAVAFAPGCPWRCVYCHNRHLQNVQPGRHDFEELLELLHRRAGLLDGVVFSGGEPCMYQSLGPALRRVRALGFETALHTSGAFPEQLAKLLGDGLLDWVALDVKAPLRLYEAVTGDPTAGLHHRRALEALLSSGVPCELRTTVSPALLDVPALEELGQELRAQGARSLVLQACRPEMPGPPLAELADRLRPILGTVTVRA